MSARRIKYRKKFMQPEEKSISKAPLITKIGAALFWIFCAIIMIPFVILEAIGIIGKCIWRHVYTFFCEKHPKLK